MSRNVFLANREMREERARDRADLEAEHATPPMPATCGTCGARIFVRLWPQVENVDEGGGRHACRRSLAGRARLVRVREEHERVGRAAARRERRRVR